MIDWLDWWSKSRADACVVRSRFGERLLVEADLLLTFWGWETNNRAEIVKETRPPRCSLGGLHKRSITTYTQIERDVGKVDFTEEDFKRVAGTIKRMSPDRVELLNLVYRNKASRQEVCNHFCISMRTYHRWIRAALEEFIFLRGLG